jgi:glucosamine--fructose-6-phosphate aminotransferase (isomerizing)
MAGDINALHGPDRAEQFLDDILAAPDEFAGVLSVQRAAIAALQAGRLDELLARPRRRLIGMGSSRFAAIDAAARWRIGGFDAVAETASASGPSRGGPDTLAIVISSSGSTAETVAAAGRHRDAGSHVLAMTSRPDSELAARADTVLPLRAARAETSGVATLTYLATIAGLLTLDRDGAIDAALDMTPRVLASVINSRGDWVGLAADLLDTGREVHVLGDGIHAGLTEQAALMFREAPRIAALPFDTGDWLHVGLYTLFPGDGVLLITGSPADALAIETIHARGGHVVVIGARRDGADLSIPATRDTGDTSMVHGPAASVVADCIAAELWRRSGADAPGDDDPAPHKRGTGSKTGNG